MRTAGGSQLSPSERVGTRKTLNSAYVRCVSLSRTVAWECQCKVSGNSAMLSVFREACTQHIHLMNTTLIK